MENRISQIETLIKKNHFLSLNELAEEACMSRVHFQREFKKEMGITPGVFLEVFKIKRSIELLMQPENIQEIAYSLGYNNYETFSRNFKKYCQISPSELQYFLQLLEKETDENSPVVISYSRKPEDLANLVNDSIERGVVVPERLEQMRICIIDRRPGYYKSRRPEKKYAISFENELAPLVLKQLQL